MITKALFLELKTRYKEFFESKLALALLQHSELFPSVKKISAAIIKLIKANRDAVLIQIETNNNIKKELYDLTFFGRFNYHERKIETAEHILNTMLKILENDL